MTEKEFEMIVSSTKKAVLGAIRNYLNPGLSGSIDDVAQEVYIRLYSHLVKKGIDAIAHDKLNSYVYVMSKNESIRFNKKFKLMTIESTDNESEVNEYDHEIEHKKEMIDQLGTEHKKVAQLYIEGYKPGEIASILKLPHGTIKSRIHHIRKKLSKQLES